MSKLRIGTVGSDSLLAGEMWIDYGSPSALAILQLIIFLSLTILAFIRD